MPGRAASRVEIEAASRIWTRGCQTRQDRLKRGENSTPDNAQRILIVFMMGASGFTWPYSGAIAIATGNAD